MGSPRTRDHSPIFQVMFVLQNFRHQVPELAGLHVQDVDTDPSVSKLDLTLEIIEGERLACSSDDCDNRTIEHTRVPAGLDTRRHRSVWSRANDPC
jgi:hypothetical protein